jgi:hypothetical protein
MSTTESYLTDGSVAQLFQYEDIYLCKRKRGSFRALCLLSRQRLLGCPLQRRTAHAVRRDFVDLERREERSSRLRLVLLRL